MELIQYIIFGIIQGITEPIPVSSSGHLFLFKNVFNTNMFNDLNFEIIVNFGSFLAILFIFRKDVIKLLKGFFGFLFGKKVPDEENENKKDFEKKRSQYKIDFKYCMLIIVGSIPVGIGGILLKDKIESMFNSVQFLGIAFTITALALFLVRKMNGTKEDKDITYKDAIIIGLIQLLALCPGISRSGSVLVGCLLCGLKRETALKYTFMLYFPVSMASMLLGVIDLLQVSNLASLILPYSLGMIAALIVTLFSYKWLSEWVKKGKLWMFSIYCLCLALFIFIYFR